MSHSATSRHARELGDPVLADICMAIANDERRHELAYTRIVDELWNLCAHCASYAVSVARPLLDLSLLPAPWLQPPSLPLSILLLEPLPAFCRCVLCF